MSKTLTHLFNVYTINTSNYEYDTNKNTTNVDKHGVSLSLVECFEWETAVIRVDTRKSYPEQRFEAIGYIENRLHVMVYCLRVDVVRVISLRKANLREEKRYAET